MRDIEPQVIQVTKINAVLRQLETAITLWFNNGDPISIHTLASAAYQILYDLNKHQKGPAMMPDSDLINPTMKDEWRRALRAWPNFLKHANKDPYKTIKFNPDINLFILFDAVMSYNAITKNKLPPILHTLFIWVFVHHPLGFQTEIADNLRKICPVDKLIKFNRARFFQYVNQIILSGVIDHNNSLSIQ